MPVGIVFFAVSVKQNVLGWSLFKLFSQSVICQFSTSWQIISQTVCVAGCVLQLSQFNMKSQPTVTRDSVSTLHWTNVQHMEPPMFLVGDEVV